MPHAGQTVRRSRHVRGLLAAAAAVAALQGLALPLEARQGMPPQQAGQATPAAAAAAFDVEQVAPGVHVLIRRKLPGFLMDANVTFIVNDEDVVVVDTNLTPGSAEASIRALRAITSKPVRTVINTHWHVDHTSGNQVYRREFPGVEFVGQRLTRDDLAAKGAQNRKDMGEQAVQFVAMLRGMLKDGKTFGGGPISPSERAAFEADIQLTEELIAAIPAIEIVPPTTIVDEELVLQRGRRRIELRRLGSSHTHGDLVVHLPQDRVVITGDLVVGPTPLIGADQSFIGEWARSLDALLALGASVYVPGHGPVLRDDAQVKRLRDFMAAIDRHAAAAIARGDTLEQARSTLDVDAFRAAMAGDDPMLRLLFANYGKGPGLAAAYRERVAAK
jgi:cyclase